MKKNYGFVKPKIDSTHYLAGTLPKVVIQPDGQWDAFLPTYEPQFGGGWDTDGCTVWGSQNALETYIKKLTSLSPDYSERYTYILAGIRPPGGDPHVVLETIRKQGVISQAELPMTQNFNEFITPDPMTQNYLNEGQSWLSAYDFGHEWIISGPTTTNDRVAIIKEMLRYSPVCASVTAWYQGPDGIYIDRGQPNCHWCEIYGWDDSKRAWKVFDSYDQSQKLYSWDSNIEFGKRLFVQIKTKDEQISTIKRLINALLTLLGFIEKHPNAQPMDNITPSQAPTVMQPTSPVPQTPASPYDWSTPELAKHSVRVICDEEDLSLADKNDLCATVGGESGWDPKAVGKPNKDQSRDWGICQINDKLWIGVGKTFPSTDYVSANPEKCIRWMCTQWKAGHQNWWDAYKNGSYKKYL